jgi:predicted regulator of Ras-like GTPase activity (Roadblock/LC7/MglB family)
LRVVLRGIAPVQISGPTGEVPDAARVDIPFSIVEPQLSLGRVFISPAQFVAGLPAEFRDRFKVEDPHTPIPIPLEEVLKHLPGETLRVRADQEAPEPVPAFETPFSQKAAEDAVRLQGSAPEITPDPSASDFPPNLDANKAPSAAIDLIGAYPESSPSLPGATGLSAKPVVKLAPSKTLLRGTSSGLKTPENDAPVEQPVERTPLQRVFDTNDPLDPKSIVSHVCLLAGVRACAIMFSDGLSLADNFPRECTVDALCAVAPTIVQKIAAQIPGANFGSLHSITLFCAKESVSFFAREPICLAALHAGPEELAAETRARLRAAVEELARVYGTQPNEAPSA